MPSPNLVITQAPYSAFLREAVLVDGFAGLRLNTVMPVKADSRRERLLAMRNACAAAPLWVDLKTRQLRVAAFANVPYTSVRISHRVRCALPTTAYFDNGRQCATLAAVDGFELIFESPLGRLVGPGESVNIPDSCLEYLDEDFLTEEDSGWVEACKSVDNHHYMLSFVESARDVELLKAMDPRAVVQSKIESRRGLERIEEIAAVSDSLLAARGDLFVEIAPPHEVDAAVHRVVEVGRERAVVGSRVLESLLRERVPSLSDLADLHRLREWGVETVLLGDDLCFNLECLARAARILKEVWSVPPAS